MSTPSSSKKILEILETLDSERQNTLLQFAEFLQSKGNLVNQEIPEPLDIPRPESETVVGAIKRLKETYPMVESMAVFSSASALMTDHMVKGREVQEVIDEMEALFSENYQQLLKDKT
jgi:hypothetical protein